MEDVSGQRDWNADLKRLLAPFRSEAAAFRLLMVVAAAFVVFLAVVLLARALG